MKKDTYSPLVSIIIPAYNVKDYLTDCLDSILFQDFANFEVVVVNDGSTDGTSLICDKYAKLDHRVKVINQDNHGVSYSRNVGIESSKGEYIVFVDSDDYIIKKDFLSNLSGLIDNHPEIIAYGYNVDDPNDRDIALEKRTFLSLPDNELTGDEYLLNVLEQNPNYAWYPWRYAINRDFWIKNEFVFPNGRVYEDVSTMWRVIHTSKSIRILKDFEIMHRVFRSDSITKVYSFKNLSDWLESACQNMQRLSAADISNNLATLLERNFSSAYYSLLINIQYDTDPAERENLYAKSSEKHELFRKKNKTFKYSIVDKFLCLFGFDRGLKILNNIKQIIKK